MNALSSKSRNRFAAAAGLTLVLVLGIAAPAKAERLSLSGLKDDIDALDRRLTDCEQGNNGACPGTPGAEGPPGADGRDGIDGRDGAPGPLSDLVCETGEVAAWDGTAWVCADIDNDLGNKLIGGASRYCLDQTVSTMRPGVEIDQQFDDTFWTQVCGGAASIQFEVARDSDRPGTGAPRIVGITPLELTGQARSASPRNSTNVMANEYRFSGLGGADSYVIEIFTSPLNFELVPLQIKNQIWQAYSLGAPKPVTVEIRLGSFNASVPGDAFTWWEEFAQGNGSRRNFQVIGGDTQNDVLIYDFVDCIPLGWSGSRGYRETLLSLCTVSGIYSAASPLFSAWFDSALMGVGTAKDIGVIAFDSQGNEISKSVYQASLPATYYFPYFSALQGDQVVSEGFVVQPQGLLFE